MSVVEARLSVMANGNKLFSAQKCSISPRLRENSFERRNVHQDHIYQQGFANQS